MFRIICAIIGTSGLLLGAVPEADAHGQVYNGYESTRHYHGDVYERRTMPRWLWRKPGFRHWYFRSSLRFNRQLAWWQLYDIYRWERRYDHRRHARAKHYTRHHDYRWYSRYWRDHERRDRRDRERRRYRH